MRRDARRPPAWRACRPPRCGRSSRSPAVVAADACRVAPAGVEGVVLDGLLARQAGEALEHHHHGHHKRGHAAAPLVGEELVREELVALAVQDRLDRALGKGLFAEAVQVVEPVALAASQAEAHSPVSSKRGSDTPVILARYLGSARIPVPGGYLPPLRPPPRGRSRQRRQQPPRSRAQPGPLLGPKAGRHRHEGGCRQLRERHQRPGAE